MSQELRRLAALPLIALLGCVPPTQPGYYSQPGAQPGLDPELGQALEESPPSTPGPDPEPDAAPTQTGAAPAPQHGNSRLTFTPPVGFAQNQGWWVTTKEEARWKYTIITAGMALPLAGIAPAADAGAALRSLWAASMPPEAKNEASGLVYRRFVGDGLLAYYLHGNGIINGDQPTGHWFTLYLVDCGDSWEPLVVGSIYKHTTTGGWFSESVGQGMADGLASVEPLLATLRCAGSRNRQIVPPDQVVGHYHYGNGASQMYVNVYTGSTSSYNLAYSGDYDLRADGTLAYQHSSASGYNGATNFQGEESGGRWSVTGDLLVLEMTSLRRTKRFRIASVTNFPNEKVMILLDENQRADPDTVRRGQYLTTKSK